MAYSNLGMSLLGHAVSRAAGTGDWAQLVHDRIFAPLGMHDTGFAAGPDDSPSFSPRSSGGPEVEAWTGTGYAPAGVATRTTTDDLVRFARAVLDGTAPGLAALDPLGDPAPLAPGAPAMRTGMAWMLTTDSPGAPVAWHNGGTGGTRTMIAIDVAQQRASVVLNATTRDATGLGMLLVGQEGWPPSLPEIEPVAEGALAALFVAQLLLGAIFTRSRTALLAALALAAAGVILLGCAAPWATLPGWLFGSSAGLLASGALVAARRWSSLPWLPNGPIRRALTFIPVLVAAPLFGWMLVVLVLRLT